jgi:hypothetical protein
MKQFLLLLIILEGCKPASKFISCNELQKENVVLFMTDKSTRRGEITIALENFSSLKVEYKPFIQFIPEGGKTEENIYLSSIAGYSIGSDYYALKELDLYLNNKYNLLFVKRLTGENSKIQLYELDETGRGNDLGEVRYSYFLSLPSFGEKKTMNTRSSALIPQFDEKMSKIVDDCPVLAEKIRQKEKGYFIPMTSFKLKKHPEVLLKIINEYNNCIGN